MKNEIRIALMCLVAATSASAFAQNTTDSRCGITNYDSSRKVYTITDTKLKTATQQCFITVVSVADKATTLSTSQLVEGNYEITLSGGGGGGGGGVGHNANGDQRTNNGGVDGTNAVPSTTTRYLNPGNYRLTIGTGGRGGKAGANSEDSSTGGMRGKDGAPTSISNATSNETVAGYTGAESWDGTYPSGIKAPNSKTGATGGAGGKTVGSEGVEGKNGYIKLTLCDTPVTKAAPTTVEPAKTVTPTKEVTRPVKKERN